ncbi:GntR family transcriptional regulator [Atlantibacter subterraneus]|nr:GntR family transcriptional regulator [Atlantibacter subterranea]MDA3133725.1 GntR family transcriptional regulator [Atlantibacter subterranea]MDV7023440.1 GntR family transcriptional regulator [Atlantibacter subterranea]MDW2744119.1 GntR family transcriptional regulator [Atlantibacter subterranea]MDZ5666266.1 GntR family transcriptional regulator [Atlantibacter hermannii]
MKTTEFNPKYLMVAEDIKNKIGTLYTIGQLLPAEPELEKMYMCSRATIRGAISYLASLGYVTKSRGIGTTVKMPSMMHDNSKPISFTDEMAAYGKQHSTSIKDFTVIKDARIASELEMGREGLILRIARLRHIEKKPALYETSYLPYERFKGITEESIKKHGLYHMIAQCTGEYSIFVEEVYHPVLTGKRESEMLGLEPGTPIIKIVRQATNGGMAMEYTEAFAHPVNYQVTLSMKRG